MARPRLLDLPGGLCVIDEDDWPMVRAFSGWHVSSNGYVVCSIWRERRSVLIHRLIMDAPAGTHVDHIDGDKLNNRRSNLRVVSPSLNQVNRKRLNRNNRSGIRGVQPFGKKWRAQITHESRNIHIGIFATQAEAVAARLGAEKALYGERCPDPAF